MLVERSSSKNGSKNIGCLVVSPPKIILIKLGSSSQIYLTVERLTKHCSKCLKIITNDIWMWRAVKGTYTKIFWKWANHAKISAVLPTRNWRNIRNQADHESHWNPLLPKTVQSLPSFKRFMPAALSSSAASWCQKGKRVPQGNVPALHLDELVWPTELRLFQFQSHEVSNLFGTAYVLTAECLQTCPHLSTTIAWLADAACLHRAQQLPERQGDVKRHTFIGRSCWRAKRVGRFGYKFKVRGSVHGLWSCDQTILDRQQTSENVCWCRAHVSA